jgi:hypothetical protein
MSGKENDPNRKAGKGKLKGEGKDDEKENKREANRLVNPDQVSKFGEYLPWQVRGQTCQVLGHVYVPPFPHKGILLQGRLQILEDSPSSERDPRGATSGVRAVHGVLQDHPIPKQIGNRVGAERCPTTPSKKATLHPSTIPSSYNIHIKGN